MEVSQVILFRDIVWSRVQDEGGIFIQVERVSRTGNWI